MRKNISDSGPDQPTVRGYILAYQRATGTRLSGLYIPTFVWKVGFTLLDGLLRLARGASPGLAYRLQCIAAGPRYDTTSAQQDLGWEARVSFAEGIQMTYAETP